MQDQFTESAKQALKRAKQAAKSCGQGYIGSEHLLVGLFREKMGTAHIVLEEAGVDEDQLLTLIEQLIAPEGGVILDNPDGYSPRAETILENSKKEADFFQIDKIGTEHILLALLRDVECVATRLLHTMGIHLQKMYSAIMEIMGADEETYKAYLQEVKASKNKQKTSSTPMLDQYSRDLTYQASVGDLDPVIGRDEEINRIIQILSRRTKNNPCLIGEPGVGKTAIAEGLASKIIAGAVPRTIQGKRVVTLDLASMIAGSKYRGEFEERIKKVIREVMDCKDVLLFIDELHTIIGAGGAEGAMDASNILKPSLSRGEIQLIGATTIDEYRKYIEKDPALERRFQPVMVEEPSQEETIAILKGLRPRYESHHHVIITDEAVEAAVKYSERYINDRFLPDKAIDLIDEASSKIQLKGYETPASLEDMHKEITQLRQQKENAIKERDFERAGQIKQEQDEKEKKLNQLQQRMVKKNAQKKLLVQEADIAEIVSMWTKIPIQKLAEKETQRLLKLENTLHQRVIGQDEAVVAVAKAIKRGRVGLKDPKRPIGSFLFLGPTGVGKTELSKAVAETVFGNEQSMIRVDMSEYMEKHSVSKLVGSPPGYVGYEEGGQLSEKVRRNPYSVILFDEIEKAHPDVFNILLQVLDDGHITDAQGRKVDFKNTILIMTSNAGAQSIISPKKLGFAAVDDAKENYKKMKDGVMEEVRRMFKPEFLNRIDEIMVFHSLTHENIKSIVGILIKDFVKRCKEQMNITLQVRDAVKSYIAESGFDDKYGARPLKRAIQNKIEDTLAEEILEGRVKEGNTVNVGITNKIIKFHVQNKSEL